MDRHILDNMNWPAHKLKKEFFPEMSETSVHNRKKELGWRAPEKEIWPDDKIQRLSELYVHGGTKWVQEHPEFLGMTAYQVQKKAEKYHLKRDGRPVNLNWSLEETLILEEELRKPNGQRRSYEEISDLMPRHSALAVKRRMKRMMDKKDTWLN